MKKKLFALAAALSLSAVSGIAVQMAAAQDAPTLPGGAGSLTETHGDWIVACGVQNQDGKQGKICAVIQEQRDSKSGLRVLRVELQPKGKKVEGTAVLPFGLTLQDGVTLQIDDGQPGGPMPFSTCMPGGCILPIDLGPDTLKSLAAAKQLKFNATASGVPEAQKAVVLSASLNGFSSALKRAGELVQ